MMEDILYSEVSYPAETKFVIDRPSVFKRLKAALEKPLTIIVAGAGYGKTQAVSMFLNAEERNVVWLLLSELDNAVSRFWERVTYGFQPYSQELAQHLKSLGYPETVFAFDKFLHMLAETIAKSGRPFVLVLDDFYLIYERSILNFLEMMISARIQGLSIVVISRVMPGLSVAGMRAKGLVSYVTEDELRFTPEETRVYCEGFGLKLSDQMIMDVHHHSEGWVLATYLICLSVKQGKTQILTSASLVDINSLIEQEVFAPVTAKLKKLLIKLAILDAIPRELLTELSEADPDIAKEMSRRNLLMRYEPFSDSYHIHRLFKEFLLKRKNRLPEEQVRSLHHTVAGWYEDRGHLPEAMDHYIECGNYGKVFDIILSMDRRLSQSATEAMIAIIENVPQEQICQRPIMLVLKALYLFMNNRIDRAYDDLEQLKVEYENRLDTEQSRAILGEVYILLALISIVRQGDEYEQLFMMADKLLPKGSALVDHRLDLAEGINVIGIMNSPVGGLLEKKRDAMFRAMPFASRVMNGCASGAEYLNATDVCFMTGDMQGAEKNAYEAIFSAEKKQQYGIKRMAEFYLVRIGMVNGDYQKLRPFIDEFRKHTDASQMSDSPELCDIIWGWVCVKLGEIDKIPHWIRLEEETRKLLPPVMVGREYLVRSDALLAEARYHELLAFMTQTDVLYRERGILYAVIQNKITRAIIHHYMGNGEESVQALNEAYELSNPHRLIIQYIEYGNQMRTVIGAAKRSANCTIPTQWLDMIYTKSSAYAKQVSSVIRSYLKEFSGERRVGGVFLSKREKEALTCLSNGLTRMEIADSLELSVNTVKSILQGAYSKLGATKGVDAVQIAVSMGLIDSPVSPNRT